MYDPLLIILVTIVIVQNALLLSRRRVLNKGERSILVDTSVLIDGRILDIADARFIPGRLLIPRSVLGELQLLADGSDHEKRLRARNGLELITKLQAVPRLNVDIYQDSAQASEGVDNRLLTLASKNGFEICTVDYNLQKVADAQGIKTLSINELSRNLKALYLPGERIEIPLTQKGQDKSQAIGYASDGTMVVVDGADSRIGQTVGVEIIRSLQTNSGKMMFARLAKDQPAATRGDSKSGSRMIARLSKGSQSRQPRDTNASTGNESRRNGGRMFGRPRNDRTDAQASSVAPRAATEASTDAPTDTAAPKSPSSTSRSRTSDAQSQATAADSKPQSQRRSRRSSTPEDNLMDLVNKQ